MHSLGVSSSLFELPIGRDHERNVAQGFLGSVTDGPAGLIIEGEAGIGKTTLWRQARAAAEAASYRVLSCRPGESDTKLSFASLGDLMEPVAEEVLTELPGPQRRALEVALLRIDAGPWPLDQRAVGAAVLSSLILLSRTAPVLVAIDDVQWLDRPSRRVMEFAAGRLRDSAVGFLLAQRSPPQASIPLRLERAVPEDRLKRLVLGPLSLAALHELIKANTGVALPRPTLLRLASACGGNPFYALEIARALEETEGAIGTPRLPIPDRVADVVLKRIRRLPAATREALLEASALSQPTLDLLDEEALPPAEQRGMITVNEDGRVGFRHPIFAAAVYADASPTRRRKVHRKLGERVTEIEERARHIALATQQPDASVAELLERAAAHARSRGAPDAAAELEERAVQLTPTEDTAAGSRLLAAAGDYFHAGALARSRALLTRAQTELGDRRLRATALRLLAQVRFRENSVPVAIKLLHEAAAAAGADPELRAPVELDLIFALVSVSVDHEQARPHALALLDLAERLADPALRAEALAVLTMIDFLLGGGVDKQGLAQALSTEDPEHRVPVEFRPTLIAGFLAFYTGDFAQARRRLYPLRTWLRDRGLEGDLPVLLGTMVWLECWAGDLATARRLAAEGLEVALLTESDTETGTMIAFGALVEAHAGRVESCRAMIDAAMQAYERSGHGIAAMWTTATLGFLELSLGNPATAHQVFDPLSEFIENQGLAEPIRAIFLPDHIEALVALGQLDRARRLTKMLAASGRKHDRPWALATSERCRSLILAADGDPHAALIATKRALMEHQRLPMPLELGRTLLVRGGIERRAKQKAGARKSIQEARAIFERLGARLWAERASTELGRIGPVRGGTDELTPVERRVAELAASGRTNRETAAELFMSPKTVEAHLARTYRKLGISSRAELGALVAPSGRIPRET